MESWEERSQVKSKLFTTWLQTGRRGLSKWSAVCHADAKLKVKVSGKVSAVHHLVADRKERSQLVPLRSAIGQVNARLKRENLR
jgi:hypothetical protein